MDTPLVSTSSRSRRISAWAMAALRFLRRTFPYPSSFTRDGAIAYMVGGSRDNFQLWTAVERRLLLSGDFDKDDALAFKKIFRRGCVRSSAAVVKIIRPLYNSSFMLAAPFPLASVVLGALAVWTGRHDAELLLVGFGAFLINAVPVYAVLRRINAPTLTLALASLIGGAAGLVIAGRLTGEVGLDVVTAIWSGPATVPAAVAKGFSYAGFSSLLLAVMCIVVTVLFAVPYQRIGARRYPAEFAFWSSTRVGRLIFDREQDLNDLDERWWALRELEWMARCLEVGYSRKIRVPNSQERVLVQAKYSGLAAEIRRWQVAVAIPHPAAVHQLQENLIALYRALLLAEYETFPGYADGIDQSAQRLRQFRTFARDLAVAVTPLAVLQLAVRLDAPIEGAWQPASGSSRSVGC